MVARTTLDRGWTPNFCKINLKGRYIDPRKGDRSDGIGGSAKKEDDEEWEGRRKKRKKREGKYEGQKKKKRAPRRFASRFA